MRKLLLVESTAAELIPEEFRDSWGIKGATIWAELQATPEDFREYEELRIALDDKLEQIRQRADLTPCETCDTIGNPEEMTQIEGFSGRYVCEECWVNK